nr:uncharacterized protein LOC119181252 [Rhipicephalus microplus]
MSSVRCAVKGCQSRRETSEGVFFHTLPASAARKRVWEKAIGCSSLPHSARVCSAHFLGSDYLPKYGNRRLVNRLRWTAVPSVDLPTNGDAAPLRQYGQRRPRGTVTTQTAFYQCTVGVQAFTLVVGRNVGVQVCSFNHTVGTQTEVQPAAMCTVQNAASSSDTLVPRCASMMPHISAYSAVLPMTRSAI